MADYFMMLDAAAFENRIRPVLTASWRLRSFEPCRSLCAEILPAASAYAQQYHVAGPETITSLVAEGLPFDRRCWRALVGEVLLFSAVEIPEFQTCEDTLCRLLAPVHYREAVNQRECLALIQKAHRGTRDLVFGSAVYRPEHAGYNNLADVGVLADYLAAVRPETWKSADLIGLRGVEEEAEREEELAFARDWFPALATLFQHARESGRVVVHESIY